MNNIKMGVLNTILTGIQSIIKDLQNSLSQNLFLSLMMFIFAIIIAIVAYIIWKFYNTLSKKDFIVLNLKQYNWSTHPVFKKVLAVMLYFVEYILIMPGLIILWFLLLSLVLLVLAPEQSANLLLMLSGSMILSIRLLSYIKEEISKDLAKMFPFIALSVFLLQPNEIKLTEIISKLNEIPFLLENIFYFFIFIFISEIILRVIYTLTKISEGEEEVGLDEKEEEKD